jgi:hypothetical protein
VDVVHYLGLDISSCTGLEQRSSCDDTCISDNTGPKSRLGGPLCCVSVSLPISGLWPWGFSTATLIKVSHESAPAHQEAAQAWETELPLSTKARTAASSYGSLLAQS